MLYIVGVLFKGDSFVDCITLMLRLSMYSSSSLIFYIFFCTSSYSSYRSIWNWVMFSPVVAAVLRWRNGARFSSASRILSTKPFISFIILVFCKGEKFFVLLSNNASSDFALLSSSYNFNSSSESSITILPESSLMRLIFPNSLWINSYRMIWFSFSAAWIFYRNLLLCLT